MLSKNQTKFITSLGKKKYRNESQLFIVEGVKVVQEFLLSAIELDSLFCTEDVEASYLEYHPEIITEKELSKISNLSSSNKVLGIFKIPKPKKIKAKGLILALDNINDPGNLGTIIRLCDWFGIKQIVCTPKTVDAYNSKVVQSSMGSLSRISIQYLDVEKFLKETSLPIYGAVMDGKPIHTVKTNQNSILVMGSESHGISNNIIDLILHKITIPKHKASVEIDSLNVATATAILLYEFSM